MSRFILGLKAESCIQKRVGSSRKEHPPRGSAEPASRARVSSAPVSDASPALARPATAPSASSFHLLFMSKKLLFAKSLHT